jgi:hypothetical protein
MPKRFIESSTVMRICNGDNPRSQAQAFFAEGKYSEAEARINETLKIYRAATSQQFINYAMALLVAGFDLQSDGQNGRSGRSCFARPCESGRKMYRRHISYARRPVARSASSWPRKSVFPKPKRSSWPAMKA